MKRIALLATLALAACSSNAEQAAWLGTIDTLANGTIVVSNPATGIWDSTTAWTLKEEIVIGEVEGDSNTILSEVRALEVGRDGRIYLLDGMAHRVLMYDSTGKLIKALGREGDGPGEFRRPNGMGWDSADRLWVVEGPSDRYTLFDANGNFISTQRRITGSYGYIWNGKFLNNGTLVEQVFSRDTPGGTQAVIVRYDTLRGMVDSLPLPYLLTGDNMFNLQNSEGIGAVMSVPYYPSNWNWIDPRGYIWVGRSDSYELTRLGMTGDTVQIIRKDHRPVPVSPAERDSAIERVKKVANGMAFDQGRIPENKPLLERMLVDDRGTIFVLVTEPQGTTGTRFDVFDPEGRYLGQVETPRRIGPWRAGAPVLVRGGKMWAVVADEDDVPGVVRWRVGKP